MKKSLLFMLLIGSLFSAQEKVSIGVIPFTSSYDKNINFSVFEVKKGGVELNNKFKAKANLQIITS
ncbi:hypothetical protein [Chryseobacterium sp. 6424]|uniref:hypothetical protein n=1 Tax=Chryseobacterium sp. 6424 TaxID=2039166 RepID=UPI0013CE80BD|nr:hypothetical protein [Chryseobacterium sp. 6424]